MRSFVPLKRHSWTHFIACALSVSATAKMPNRLRESLSESALAALKAAAEHDPQKAIVLARRYRQGDGVDKNLATAESWAKKTLTLPAGQLELARVYLDRGDRSEGLRWMTSAAEAGNAEAAYELGSWLLNGTFGVKDVVAAVRWFEKSGDLGRPQSYYDLATIYRLGISAPMSKEAAARPKTSKRRRDCFTRPPSGGSSAAR